MKVFIVALATFTLNFAFAITDESIRPYMDFDEDILNAQSNMFSMQESRYLVVVPEEWSFPSRTRRGKKQKQKFEKALEILEEVMNSDRFRRHVLAYKRADGKRLYFKNYLWGWKSETMTNEEVYELIMNGSEKMRPDTDGEMNINAWVKVCSRWERNLRRRVWCRKVIGSTEPSASKWMKLNWEFYKKFETPEMIGNIVHEWLHLLGFLHGPKETMREEVPYVVGGIASKIAQEILAEKRL